MKLVTITLGNSVEAVALVGDSIANAIAQDLRDIDPDSGLRVQVLNAVTVADLMAYMKAG